MSMTISQFIAFQTETCCKCGVQFALPADYRQRLINTHENFYCPNGHPQHYSGESEVEKLRKELKRKEQEIANVVSEKLNVQSDLLKANRKLKRVHRGVCPCCNRSFENLERHMKTKHKEIIKEGKC